MGELNANDIAHAASDVTENLLTAFSSKPNLTEQQQLLIKLTKQVEDAKKALLDRQIASLQSEIDKAATEITIASGPGKIHSPIRIMTVFRKLSDLQVLLQSRLTKMLWNLYCMRNINPSILRDDRFWEIILF